jgi:spore maturation protein CgeB
LAVRLCEAITLTVTRFGNQKLRLAIVGNSGGTNVSESLRRAALALKYDVFFFDRYRAWRGSRILRSLSWRLNDKKPPRLKDFVDNVLTGCAYARPETLIATGIAPLTAVALEELRRLGIICINYSTDDPWNPTQTANWFLHALPIYDLVFTTRRANVEDFRRVGCGDVQYLPFGYDDELFRSSGGPTQGGAHGALHDVLFVGGADKERVAFISEFMNAGPAVALVGDYWETARQTRRFALGHKPPEEVRILTAAAQVNLCLVRRANRDGHVMRSFEIAALGGCMLAEDTAEHREIFGDDGEAVAYFRSPREAADRARILLANPAECARLSAAVRERIVLQGAHTYRDRLVTILGAAERHKSRRVEPQRMRLLRRPSAPDRLDRHGAC